jgi:hypothetical protein
MKKALVILIGLSMLVVVSCASKPAEIQEFEDYVVETVLYFPDIQGNLGPMNIRNQDTQLGWGSNGTDGKQGLDIEKFTTAKTLVLQLTGKPAGGLQVIWQGTADGWNWNQNDGVLSDTGVPNAAKGATLSASNVLTIDLTKALNKYAEYQTCEQVKILLGYYSPNIAALGITKADFTY